MSGEEIVEDGSVVATIPDYENTLFVRGVTGIELEVLVVDEKVWFQTNLLKYVNEYRFENIADLQDVDRLLGLELLSYRYTAWLTKGQDYDGLQFQEKDVRDHKQKIDTEIRMLKKHMGMDRKGRVESESESVSDYLKNLHRRAEEFGIHRDNQIAVIMDIFNDLKTMVLINLRIDEEEQRELGASRQQIFEWIIETAIPRYDEVDNKFRQNQRLWIQEVS